MYIMSGERSGGVWMIDLLKDVFCYVIQHNCLIKIMVVF